MGLITLDFSSVKENVLLDEGTYAATIKKAETKNSSTGKPMLVVLFEENETGTGLFENFLLTEEAAWKLKQLASAVGLDTSEISELDTDELIGVEVKIKVIQEAYQDELKNRIKKILAA